MLLLMLIGAIDAGAALFAGPSYAAGMVRNIHQGDTLILKAGDWDKEYLVLDPAKTSSGETGAFVLQKGWYSGPGIGQYNSQEIRFDPAGMSNAWEGSNAQNYCTEYYRAMPDRLREAVIGVKTTETGALGSNNIDGTRTGEDADKDKVFAMSFAEFYRYRDHIYKNNGTKDFKWWLRSPDSGGTNMAKTVNGGRDTQAVAVDSLDIKVRPAFNLRLPDDFCASGTVRDDGSMNWTVDMGRLDHSYDEPVYEWSGGGEKCTAHAECVNCGRTIREIAYSTSDLAADGSTVYTAEFGNELFETQEKTVRTDGLSGSIMQGDILRFREGTKVLDFIVMDPAKTSTGNDGMFLLLKTSTEKTCYDESEQSNQWEGSTAQNWCTEFYNDLPAMVKASVIGVKTRDTESGQDWLGVNNIDGTKTAKDKVFFLSYREYSRYRNVANVIAPYKWLLRNYGVDCASDIHAYVGVIQENGEPKDYGIHSALAARPAFNFDLANDVRATKTSEGGSTVWTIDTADPTADPAADQTADQAAAPAGNKDEISRLAEISTKKKARTYLPGVKILNPKGGKKALTARWKKIGKKNRKKIKGIEIRVKGPGLNRIYRAKNTKTYKKIKGLKSGKTYRVQVRGYCKRNGVKYVSKWSKVRKVKVR